MIESIQQNQTLDKKAEILKLIQAQGLLPLFFYKDATISVEVLKALYHAGIRSVEYTNRGEAALQNFKKLREACEGELRGMYLGIGTIKNADSARAFIDAGADYIISPGLVEDAAKLADKHNMLWVPGCMTPTEIIRAEQLGAKMIKLFPGNLLGPAFLSAIKELFPTLLFMPTGGVEVEEKNLRAWFAAGVAAVGMGSKLISKTALENKEYSKITELTKQALEIIRSVRSV
jgi:2-dehydro-3-deoxyphosphogluconate aldolase/(4S)-4-hydroxy-2-oxoglutarate aldolase